MLLIISNSADATANYLSSRLCRADIPFLRIDTDTIVENASFQFTAGNPRLRAYDTVYRPEDFSNVWYRRPEQLRLSGEAETPEARFALKEWTEALEGFFSHVPKERWMNHPSANAAASSKLGQLTTASQLGFCIPETLVTQEPAAGRNFLEIHSGAVIVKPLGTGYVERDVAQDDSIIFTNEVESSHAANLEALVACPTLFQCRVPKAFDVRITCVDEDLMAVRLLALDGNGKQRCDVRRNNMEDVEYSAVELPDSVATAVRKLLQHYSLRFAAIDMAVTASGEWVFFEVNPNGQWAWLDLAGGQNHAEAFLNSFATRSGVVSDSH